MENNPNLKVFKTEKSFEKWYDKVVFMGYFNVDGYTLPIYNDNETFWRRTYMGATKNEVVLEKVIQKHRQVTITTYHNAEK